MQLIGSNQQNSGGSDGQEDVVITTISGVRTEITLLPHPTNGNTGDDPTGTGGGGNGSGNGVNPSGGGGLGHGIIAAIVVGVILTLALLVFVLRKRVRKQRAARHTRWLSGGENGQRSTFSSFGDLRASTFSSNSEEDNDTSNGKRHSGPFSDSMAVGPPTPTSARIIAPQMTQVTHTEITPPAIAVLSTGKRSSRISQISIGSSKSDGSDDSGVQWVELRPEVRCDDGDRLSPTDRWCLPSPISVRPFTPTESWSFPKPPTSRPTSRVCSGEIKGLVDPNPFADPVPQPPELPIGSLETVTKSFEPKGVAGLAVEIGDVVSILRLCDDGWGKVKVLRKNGSAESVQGLEGYIPIDCLRRKGNKDPLWVEATAKVDYTQQLNA